jgi:hypothetical protein
MDSGKGNKLLYYDPHSIIVSTTKGLVRLHCPFNAELKKAVGLFPKGEILSVVAVFISIEKKLLFQVSKYKLSYENFNIILPD